MKVPTLLKVLIKAIAIPIISMFALNRFNLFEFISLVPEDRYFDIGLTAYLAIFEALFLFFEKWIESQRASITCVFYVKKTEKNEKNTPKVVCGSSTSHVANIYCDIQTTGNNKLLRKVSVSLNLPDWVSSQIPQNETVAHYKNNTLVFAFDKLIPESAGREHVALHTVQIPFIETANEGYSSVVLKPQLNCKLTKIYVSLSTNSFQLCNKE